MEEKKYKNAYEVWWDYVVKREKKRLFSELKEKEFYELSEEAVWELRELRNILEHKIENPLVNLYYGGYRSYDNTKDWICHFCGKKIETDEGYWAHKQMKWSEGPKLCHECFLKFLVMMEYNH